MPTANPTTPEASSASTTVWLKPFLFWAGVGLSLFQVWSVVFSTLDPLLQRVVFLTWVLALAFLSFRPQRSDWQERPAIPEILEAGVSVLSGLYYLFPFARIQFRWP